MAKWMAGYLHGQMYGWMDGLRARVSSGLRKHKPCSVQFSAVVLLNKAEVEAVTE